MRRASAAYNTSLWRRWTDTRAAAPFHALPPEAPEISAWLRKLGLGIPYRGEGLPNITYKVLLALLRCKERMYLHGYEKARAAGADRVQVCALWRARRLRMGSCHSAEHKLR
jgi:hypothetical protein